MRLMDANFACFTLTTITLIHLSFCMDNMQSKLVFYAVALGTVLRLAFDFAVASLPPEQARQHLVVVNLVESVLVRYIVHKMGKYLRSPPIILLVTTFIGVAVDVSQLYRAQQ